MTRKKCKHKGLWITLCILALLILALVVTYFVGHNYIWTKHPVEPYSYDFVENGDIELIRKRIVKAQEDAELDVAEFIVDVDENGKFKSIDYDATTRDTWHPIAHLEKLHKMQIAYNSEGNKDFHNPALKDAVTRAMQFWVKADLKCDWNWWYNEVGVGYHIPDILLFGVDGLSQDDTDKLLTNIKKALLPAEMVCNGVKERKVDSTGGNLTDKALSTLKVAVLEKDGSTIHWLTELLERELHPFPSFSLTRMRSDCSGVKEDGSFQQHDHLIYFGGYGEVFVDGMNQYLTLTKDTQYALSEEALNIYADFMLEGMQVVTRGGYRDISASGRGISRVDGLTGVASQTKSGAEILLEYGNLEREAELSAMLQNRFSETQKDTGAGKHKFYYESDYQIINNEHYMASVRSASNQTRIYEFLNGENPFAYYTGLGATFYYVNGDEYYNLLPVYDWNKIPGTTTRQGYLPYYDQVMAYGQYGTTNYISGVSNEQIGMSFMRLRNNGVRGRKAYFMFEDGMVCLGANLETYHKEPLLTCIEQSNLKSDVILGDGTTLSCGDSKSGEFSYVYHNNIGYITDNFVEVSAEHIDGDWKTINEQFVKSKPMQADRFLLTIPHGNRKSSYAYTVLPDTTKEAVEAYKEHPTLEILANTKACQAVWDNEHNALEAVFHKGGTLALPNGETLKVNKACVVLITYENDKPTITAASYNGRNTKLKLSLGEKTVKTEIGKASKTIA